MLNAITVDVEDYFMVAAFSDVVPTARWESFESRVERNTKRILELLDKANVKATFFFLGYVAQKFPGLVREAVRGGHEIGCHSHLHRRICELTPEEFRKDTRTAKAILEDITGEKILGYRAPSWSITRKTFWAIDILREEGFSYDSSVFPILHDIYGFPGFKRFPTALRGEPGGELLEIPPSTVRVLGRNVPVAGGGYLRLYPFFITEWAIRHLNEIERERAVVYLHPWEIDPGQPRLNGRLLSRFRHYVNLEKTETRLASLLGRFRFGPIREAFRTHLDGPVRSPLPAAFSG
jgi:polysaccharide deacetylase family protein (PEP-CTERM system associated)